LFTQSGEDSFSSVLKTVSLYQLKGSLGIQMCSIWGWREEAGCAEAYGMNLAGGPLDTYDLHLKFLLQWGAVEAGHCRESGDLASACNSLCDFE
jgi:hypothetical protein